MFTRFWPSQLLPEFLVFTLVEPSLFAVRFIPSFGFLVKCNGITTCQFMVSAAGMLTHYSSSVVSQSYLEAGDDVVATAPPFTKADLEMVDNDNMIMRRLAAFLATIKVPPPMKKQRMHDHCGTLQWLYARASHSRFCVVWPSEHHRDAPSSHPARAVCVKTFPVPCTDRCACSGRS